MLEILKQKILSWTPEQADAFYSNVDRVGPYGGMIYEKTDTGWFWYSAEKAAYYDLNGESHILAHHSNELEMSLYAQKTYSDYADANDLIKIEKPVIVAVDSVNELPYIYCKLVRPYNTHGIPQLNMIYVSDTNRAATALEMCKIHYKKLDEFFQVIDAVEGNLYPRETSTENLFYDPVTSNYFWGGDIAFDKQRQDSIETHLNTLSNLDYYCSAVSGMQMTLQTQVINYVNTECSILQLP